MRAQALAALLALSVPAAAEAASYTLDLQPWGLCTGGTIDTCVTPEVDATYLNQIYAQIGVEITVLPNLFVGSFPYALNGSGEAEAEDTLFTFTGFILGAVGLAPNTAYFGHSIDLEGGTLGIAFVDAPTQPTGIVQGELQNSLRETVILAHELGHVLGAIHSDARNALDLLWPAINPSAGTEGFIPTISPANAATILSSPLLAQTVPAPQSAALLGAGLLLLARRRGRRRAG